MQEAWAHKGTPETNKEGQKLIKIKFVIENENEMTYGHKSLFIHALSNRAISGLLESLSKLNWLHKESTLRYHIAPRTIFDRNKTMKITETLCNNGRKILSATLGYQCQNKPLDLESEA